jgi:2-(1,2-epoxy-1,2-dihydrophenyl)acetyl-CoA isomerase
VNWVVASSQLETETNALASRLAQGPTRAYGHIRRLLRRAHETGLSKQLQAECDAFSAGTKTNDFAEGLSAFFLKRAAQFEGR